MKRFAPRLLFLLLLPAILLAALAGKRTMMEEDQGLYSVIREGQTAMTQASIGAALTAIGDDERGMALKPGTWTISGDLVIPANITTVFAYGAVLHCPTSQTITIIGPLDAGPWQIFSGSCAVDMTASPSSAIPQWWGGEAGGADASVAIQAAAEAAYHVQLSPGIWAVENDLVIPENTLLDVNPGAILPVSATKTLTINGALRCSPTQQCFTTGGGSYRFGIGSVQAFYPEWWGAVADHGNTSPVDPVDSTAAFNAAIDAATAHASGRIKRVVLLKSARYYITGVSLNNRPVHLKGVTREHTILRRFADTGPMMTMVHSTFITGGVFEDLKFDGRDLSGTPSTTNDCLQLGTAELWSILRGYFSACRYGLFLDTDARLGSIMDSVFGSNNQRGLMMSSGANHNRIIGNWFDENLAYGLYLSNANDNVILGNTLLDNTGTHIALDGTSAGNNISQNTMEPGGGSFGTTRALRHFAGTNNRFANNSVGDHTSELLIDAGTGFRYVDNEWADASPEISDAGTASQFDHVINGMRVRSPITFATLPTGVVNGMNAYCSDCTVTSGADNTCVGSGSGAVVWRINGIWRCFNAQN